MQIKTGPTREPPRILLHGQEGIGKTTFAAACPGVLFLTAEDGGGDIDYARAVLPTWRELRSAIRELVKDPQGFRAVCIDTIDTYERLLWDHLCREANVPTIEEIGGGFGKGYVRACEEMASLQRDLDALRAQHRMAVILLAHSHVKAFSDPLGANFDRYEIRLDKRTSALWSGWADCVLFAGLDVTVKVNKRTAQPTEKGKATGGHRCLYTCKDAAYDAKNRYGLPEELDLSWADFAEAAKWDERMGAAAATPGTPPASEPTDAPTVDEVRAAIKRAMGSLGWTKDAVGALLDTFGAKRVDDLDGVGRARVFDALNERANNQPGAN